MARKRHRGGRTTPKGTRPMHFETAGGARRNPDPNPADGVIEAAARDILANDDPIAAETWASSMLELFESTRRSARSAGDEVPPFETAVLERCRERRDTSAVVVATALAAVAPPPLQRRANRVVADLSRVVKGPAWLAEVGGHHATRAYLAGDVYGDQDSILIGFGEPTGRHHHALSVLVDHNLSGQAKDAWLAGDLEELAARWRDSGDPAIRVEEIPVADAFAQVRRAMAMSDLFDGDVALRSEDFARHRALVWARLRAAGFTSTETDPLHVPQAERDQLLADFLATERAAAVAAGHPDADVEIIASCLIDLRSDYEGRPLRWSPIVVGDILTDLAPRKLVLEPADVEAFCDALRAMVRFAAERTGLAHGFLADIESAIDADEPAFRSLIDDPGSAGPAKAIITALQQQGVDLSDKAAIEAALRDLGASPLGLPMRGPDLSMTPRPSDEVALASAEEALVLARFQALADFYAEGRKLTQTGNPTLADARALITILGTDDEMDERIGDRTFKTKSAAELAELSFTIRWAVVAGALRKEHNKLIASKTWQRLGPLARWERAAEALPQMGPVASFMANARYRDPDELIDEFAQEILATLHNGPVPFEALLDGICQAADERYEWLSSYMKDPETRRRSIGWDLDRLSQILGWAGIVERSGTTEEPDRYSRSGTRVVGGTLALTPVGRWWFDRP